MSINVDERVRPKHCTLKVATPVALLRDIHAIQNFLVIEVQVWEDAYGRVHPVLNVQKVFFVSQ